MAEDEFDGGAPGGVFRGDAVEEGMEDIAGGSGADAGEAEGGEIAAVGDDGLLGVLDGAEEEGFEINDALVFLEGAGGEGFIDEVFQDFDDELEDGEVGGGAFLDIEEADFDGAAGEAGDGAAGVGPFGFEDAVGVEGGEIAGDAVEDLGLVAGAGGDPFGDGAAGDGGDAVAVMAVGFQAHVEAGGAAAFEVGGAGGEGGQEGENQPDGGVEAVEFGVAAEGEVEVGGLEIGPAVAAAVEESVEGFVDGFVAVGPEAGFAVGIHPGVHGGGEQAGFVVAEHVVESADVGLEESGEAVESGDGAVGFHFEDVENELVGPADGAVTDFVFAGGADGVDEAIGDGQDVESVGIDDHVFEFDAVAFEQGEGRAGHRAVLRWIRDGGGRRP